MYPKLSQLDRRSLIYAINKFEGFERYKLLVRCIKAGVMPDGQIRFLASLAGVQGYPITLMIERYRRTKDDLG